MQDCWDCAIEYFFNKIFKVAIELLPEYFPYSISQMLHVLTELIRGQLQPITVTSERALSKTMNLPSPLRRLWPHVPVTPTVMQNSKALGFHDL